ncbi:hypothetical protein [Thermococcus prieurii]
MESVGGFGWDGSVWNALENSPGWLTVVLRTPVGPREVESFVEEELRRHGWSVDFKANWWVFGYGVALFEAFRHGKRRSVVVKWVSGGRDEVLKVEPLDEETGRCELFSMVEMVSDGLMNDPVLRNMTGRY